MTRRAFLHVGTPKSGTTFLQSVWWAHRTQLAEQGLLLPGRGVFQHYWASCVVRGGAQLDVIPEAGHAAWDELLAATASHDGDVLISHELFSPASADRADRALRQVEAVADEVHVVLTARDLVRQIPAEWQQRTKHGRSQPFADFIEMIQRDESVNFWRVQDVPRVLDRWTAGIPAERVHLVVLPQGGPGGFLWGAACEVLGVDGTGMAEAVARSNESLGLVEAETMRRVSGVLNRDGLAKSTSRLLKDFVAEEIMRAPEPERIVLPAHAYPWVVERAEQMVAQLSGRGYDVVGDVAHLVPAPEPVPGRDTAEVAESEVAEAAVRALARFVRHEEATRRRAAHRTGSGGAPGSRLHPERVWSRLRRAVPRRPGG